MRADTERKQRDDGERQTREEFPVQTFQLSTEVRVIEPPTASPPPPLPHGGGWENKPQLKSSPPWGERCAKRRARGSFVILLFCMPHLRSDGNSRICSSFRGALLLRRSRALRLILL